MYRMEDVKRFNNQYWWTPVVRFAATLFIGGGLIYISSYLF